MKAPAMLVTPTFGETSSKILVAAAKKEITSARRARLMNLAKSAEKAYKD